MPHKRARRGKAAIHLNNRGAARAGMYAWFESFAQQVARMAGRPITFLLALSLVVAWLVTGPLFNYSDTWQLVINTATTIVTFLMVFLIQNTQNRDTLAIQLKLAELILTMKGVPNRFATIEDLSDQELESLHEECRTQADTALEHLKTRRAGPHKTKGRGGAHPSANGSK